MTPPEGNQVKKSPQLFEIVSKRSKESTLYGLYSRLSDIDRVIAKKGKGQLAFYWDMVDTDSVLAGLIDTRIDNVAALKWEIIPSSADTQDETYADFVTAGLKEINHFDDDIAEILGACVTGITVTEIVWKEWEYEGQIKLIPDRMIGRNPDFFFIRDGEWYMKSSMSDNMGTALSEFPYKFIIHQFRDRYGSMKGLSLLKSVYWTWWFKHNAFKYWLQAAEVGAEITPVILYDENASKEEIDEMEEAAQKFLKAKYYVGPDKGKMEFPSIKIDQEFASVLVDRCNQEMRFRVLGSTLSSGTDQSGSRALGSIHAEKEQDRKEQDSKSLAGTLNETLIRWMVELNYDELITFPKFKQSYETTRDVKEIRDNIKLGNEFGIPMLKSYVASELGLEMAPDDADPDDLIALPEPEIVEVPVEVEPDEPEVTDDEVPDDNSPEAQVATLAILRPEALQAVRLRKNKTQRKLMKLTEGALSAGLPVYESLGKEIQAWLSQFDSVEEALGSFGDYRIDFESFRHQMEITWYFDLLHGMFNVYDLNKVRDIFGLPRLSKVIQTAKRLFNGIILQSFWEPVEFEKATEMFLDREILSMAEFEYLEAYARRRALSASGMSYTTIKNNLHGALENALVQGTGIDEFKAAVDGLVLNPNHATVIFRTVVQSAYNTGHAEAMFDPELREAIPAMQFDAIVDNRTTPICEERDQQIYRTDLMEDYDIVPPCHFMCRSTMNPIFVDDYTGQSASAPTVQAQEGFGRFTSILH